MASLSENRPLFPRPDFADKENYRYVSQTEVASVLESFGFAPERRMVDAFYLSPDGKAFIGVLRINQERCEGHLIGNPIFQGVLGPEAIAQTWILGKIFTGELDPQTQSVRFEQLEDVRFRHSMYPDVDVNIVVRELPEQRAAYGQVICGERVMTDGIFRAVIIDKTVGRANAEKRKRMQETSSPIFPLRD